MTLPFVRDLLLALARRSPLATALARLADETASPPALAGLTPPAQMLVAVWAQRLAQRPVVLVVADTAAAEAARDLLATFAALTASGDEDEAARPLLLPAYERDPYEALARGLAAHPEILEQQALALDRAAAGLPFLVVPAAAVALRLAPPETYRHATQRLRRGALCDPQGLAEALTAYGYQRADPVEMPGQFSIRGGLFDVFSPEARYPFRLEWFGDELESLREFDPATQRSVRELEAVQLVPLTPIPLDADREARLRASWPAGEPAGEMEERAAEAGLPPGWEFRVPALEGYSHSVFDLGRDPLVLVSEPEAVAAELERWWQELAAGAAENPTLPPPERMFFPPDKVQERLRRARAIEMRELAFANIDLAAEQLELQARLGTIRPEGESAIPFSARPAPRLPGGIARVIENLRGEVAARRRVFLLGANPGEVERLSDLFTEYQLSFQLGTRTRRSGGSYHDEKALYSSGAPGVVVVEGRLPRGFDMPGLAAVFYGSDDLFPQEQQAPAPAPPARSRLSTFLSDFRDLTPGDYVVHVEHGIGRFLGLRSFEGDAVAVSAPVAAAAPGPGEFMILEYADSAKLYVPLTRLDLVQKYRSAEGAQPTLDRLGGTQWAQRKGRVRKAMKDMADELLKLYAARQAADAPRASADDHMQREFEDAFPFTETDDQARAIVDVKRDLESGRPMDRLVVGDVGFGKTEVAMRAAFKMVAAGYQVAILAPTTVLAFQHEQTFRQRFRAFPINLEMLSRFRSRAEQTQTLEKLAAGQVDVVIGTHRLLSQDVEFPRLGLLIVDEEQRFGVRHKERLKQLRQEVHVLALSATPIPRTLNMSLAGLRDLSVIETPPRDRLAIQTVVAGWDEHLITVALRQELARGGQTYFVHNRVETIFEIAELLARLVPEARLAIAHGQMGEGELERVMLRFIRHEADVLLATTIIENGLDIPLANTMFINRADRFGLSELYQLRGRVGRSNRRAYAYLLVPPQADLSPIARKRLAAMREFSDLGAGFKIAALDLELRGAGNLLGAEQSGNLDAVGFDLYIQMLEQTVRELKGGSALPTAEVQLHMGLDLRIPPEYIPEENQRLRMYKRLAEAETPEQREDVLRELRDRYGPPPAPVLNLLAYAGLRPRLRGLGIQALERRRDQVWLKFTPQSPVEPDRLARLTRATAGAQFTPQGVLKLPFAAGGSTAVLAQLDRILTELQP